LEKAKDRINKKIGSAKAKNSIVFMTVVVLIFLLIYFFFWIIVGPVVRKRSEQSFDANADNTALLTETLYESQAPQHN
jgi:ABC-type bacteriocin/lantibiotic exporter with double-glycine peptidase domain